MQEMTVKRLAEICGLSEARIRQIKRENGGRMPTVEYVLSQKGKVGRKSGAQKMSKMLAYFGTKEGFKEFMTALKKEYGENATLKEIIEGGVESVNMHKLWRR